MDLLNKLKQDMVNSMKDKDRERLTVIRMVKAAVDKERIDKKVEVTDDVFLTVLEKEVKSRKDSRDEFEKANRNDLVENIDKELKILEEYLPEPLTKEEVLSIIDGAIKELSAGSMKDMKRVIDLVTPKVRAKYDMKEVSCLIKEKLS